MKTQAVRCASPARGIGWERRLPTVLALLVLPLAGTPAAAQAACATQPPDLAAWWAGEDNALDQLGIQHAILTNGTGFAAGFVGRAFQFDGIDDQMRAGLLGGIGLTEADPLTIAAWVNSANVAATTVQVIAGNYMGEQGGSGNFSVYLRISDGNLGFSIDQRQVAGSSVSTPISNGWHFVTATYDGNTLALYLDGLPSGSTPRGFSGSVANTRGWNVGNFSDETNAAHGFNSSFNGRLDEVMVFGRALGAAEVEAIFDAGSLGVCPPMIFANGFEGSGR